MLGGMAPRFWAVLVNTLLPPLGLLLAGVSALTAFAEERVRRNLDELLATPLPTQAIVWAKWREAFRPVPWVVAPPAALSALLAWGEGGGWRFVGLLAGLVLGCGAFLTSLGLALATWIPQLSRAMTYGVGLYFFLCLGWPIAALILFDNPTGGLEVGPALLSPVVAGGVLTSALQSSSVRNIAETGRLFAWGVGWIGVLFAAAGALYYLTVTTFDRCLGRMPEGGRPRTDELTTTRFRRAATAAR
jgi:ABC-type transport system involved in multi-copper enzyme maturation permease subunit